MSSIVERKRVIQEYKPESNMEDRLRLAQENQEKWRIKIIYRSRYECGICNRILTFKRTAIDHIRYHFNIRPWKCSYCDKRCHTVTNKRAHERRHHENEKTVNKGTRMLSPKSVSGEVKKRKVMEKPMEKLLSNIVDRE